MMRFMNHEDNDSSYEVKIESVIDLNLEIIIQIYLINTYDSSIFFECKKMLNDKIINEIR
jgi:hypothetical protein